MANRYMPVGAEMFVTSGFGPRWGTVHRGVDFGKTGGSANQPVYAAQGGTVVFCGAASGFGGPDPAGWVVIDHPTEDGSGTTVYGHIIREVVLGQRVEAGQRIGRINPNSATNGGVAPHLHFEVFPRVWVPGAQLDPEPWLRGAKIPGGAPTPPKESNTNGGDAGLIWGVDVSNHQKNIDMAQVKREGFDFAFVKATEGTWRDPHFSRLYHGAKQAGMLVGAYVYVRQETSAKAHADTMHAVVADTNVPIALDIEDNSGYNVQHFLAIKREIEALGYRVILTYLPSWYWARAGRPNLGGLPPLWTSRYPDKNPDFASVIYNRAGTKGWDGYGGLDVAVWQFTSTARVAGHQIDANAFRGTRAQLEALFNGKSTILGGIFNMLPLERQEDLARKIDEIHIQIRSGWSQLGHNQLGQPLTLVDGVAALRQQVAELARKMGVVK